MNITLTAENSQKHLDYSYNDDLETKSKKVKFLDYDCEFDKDSDRSWYGDCSYPEARIVDKTIFIKDNNNDSWYSGPLVDEPNDNFIPSAPYKKLLDFIAYNRKLTIKDIKSHINYKLSDHISIVKKYEKNVAVNAIVTACKKLDDEYKAFSEKLLKNTKNQQNMYQIAFILKLDLRWSQRMEFEEEISSKLNELWNLLEYIIYFKYFDEIYENGFSRSPKVLFSEKSDMSI